MIPAFHRDRVAPGSRPTRWADQLLGVRDRGSLL